MLATPQLAKMNTEFESTYQAAVSLDTKHHLSTKSATETFARDVTALCSAIAEMGSPFHGSSVELYNLDTKTVTSAKVVETVKNIEEIGVLQFKSFSELRLDVTALSLYDTIKQNKLPLFASSTRPEAPTKAKGQIKSLKDNCNLFVAASNDTTTDLNEFFAHENQDFPPSISLLGSLRSTTKADMYRILASSTDFECTGRGPQVDVKILDGAAIVQMLRPGISITIEDYIQTVFLPFLKSESSNVSRVDIVWDTYVF